LEKSIFERINLETIEVVRVKFLWPGKMFEFQNLKGLILKRKDPVVVEVGDGSTKVGVVSVPPRIRNKRDDDRDILPILRVATDQDIALENVKDEFRTEVKNYFDTRLRSRESTGVKMVDCEKAHGGRKLIVYFTSENKKFDYKVMAKELAQRFGVRVDMRGVGIRDAARLAGGIGRCGLSTCCSTWITDFSTVSIKMAKDQGLSLDPDSINGQCGRLLCCLGYEHENYLALGKGLPKLGKSVITPVGEGRVVKLDVLKRMISVRSIEGTVENFSADDVKRKFPVHSHQIEQDDEEEDSSHSEE
jgi:cell fate regulator YaaT (PSP1 superfamily)